MPTASHAGVLWVWPLPVAPGCGWECTAPRKQAVSMCYEAAGVSRSKPPAAGSSSSDGAHCFAAAAAAWQPLQLLLLLLETGSTALQLS